MPHPDSSQSLPAAPLGQPQPLHGLTLLVVEDSRFASEAIRLMALRSGARLRRADSLSTARRHLSLYRPDVALIDIGLPDGMGTALIAELAAEVPAAPVVLALSGDPATRSLALAAGAVGFFDKPFRGLADFQRAILQHLPGRGGPVNEAAGLATHHPDRLALREDLHHAAGLLSQSPDATQRAYLSRFLTGLARATADAPLASAAATLPQADAARLAAVAGMVARRLTATPRPFA